MANGPPSEYPPRLKPRVTPLTVGRWNFLTRPGAALPHGGSLPQVRTWGRHTCFLLRAPSNLVTLLRKEYRFAFQTLLKWQL